jgi:hypothetical protein
MRVQRRVLTSYVAIARIGSMARNRVNVAGHRHERNSERQVDQ